MTRAREEAERSLAESNARLHELLNAYQEAVWITVDDQAVFANPAAERLLGVPVRNQLGHSPLDFVDPAQRDHFRDLIDRVRRGEREVLFEDVRLPLRGGGPRCVRISGASLDLPGQQANLTIARDITELRRARTALERSNRELHALVARMNDVEEEERRRIAHELHDDLQQNLAAVAIEQQRAIEDMRAEPALAEQALARARQTTADASQSLRRIVAGLRPLAIEELGLDAALEALAQGFGRSTQLQCEYERIGPEGSDQSVPVPLATSLYRVAQEALNNVHKHAHASFVHVVLDLSQAVRVSLEVPDDGVGADPDLAQRHQSFGILGMRERLMLLGGALQITPGAGGGTIVRASAPLHRGSGLVEPEES